MDPRATHCWFSDFTEESTRVILREVGRIVLCNFVFLESFIASWDVAFFSSRESCVVCKALKDNTKVRGSNLFSPNVCRATRSN